MTIRLPENLESSILDVVHRGRFESVDDAMAAAARLLLHQVGHEGSETSTTSPRQETAAPVQKPVWERIQDLTEDVPDEEWDKLPTDLAEQHDHYLYGTPKRPTR